MSAAEKLEPVPARTLGVDAELRRGEHDQNPFGVSLRELLLEDFRTHGSDLRAGGFWAIAVHRLGNRRMRVRSRALRAPLTLAYRVAYHAVIAVFGIDLPYNGRIGRRFRVVHHGCVRLNSRSVGDDVTIAHAATIGLQSRTSPETPTIGSRVEIGPGAVVVGGVHVGDDSFVGPNTVLADDLPRGAVALGVPSRTVDITKHLERGRG